MRSTWLNLAGKKYHAEDEVLRLDPARLRSLNLQSSEGHVALLLRGVGKRMRRELEVVDLSGLELSQEAQEAACALRVAELHLRSCRISRWEGQEARRLILARNPVRWVAGGPLLTQLDLRECGLLELCVGDAPNLRLLDVGANLIQDLGALLDALPRLSELRARGNRVGDAGAALLAQALARDTSCLRLLDVSLCGFQEPGLECLVQALETNTSLVRLELDQVGLQYNSEALGKMLEKNRTLAELSMRGVSLGPLCEQAVYKGIALNTRFAVFSCASHTSFSARLEGNRAAREACRSASLLLASTSWGGLQKEICILIAQFVWATRGHYMWLMTL